MKTYKRKIVVTFDLEILEKHQQEEETILHDVASYLTCLIAADTEPGGTYWLREPTVYWPEDFIADVAEGEWKEEIDHEPDPA